MTTSLIKKRDYEVKILRDAGFDPVVPDGGYFIMCDTSKLGIQVSLNTTVYENYINDLMSDCRLTDSHSICVRRFSMS